MHETRGDRIKRAKRAVALHGLEMRNRYESGDLLREIADDFGITLATVANAIRANGGQVRKQGCPPGTREGKAHPRWTGGSYVKDGYRQIWVAPSDPLWGMAHARGYAPEHRIVMARLIHRPLLPDETVHHIDGDRLNNDPSNLQLRMGRHGAGIHMRCRDCGSQNVVAEKLG